MLDFHEFLHTVYKYVLNSVVKISTMFAKYFEYYAIILRGGAFFMDTLYNATIIIMFNAMYCTDYIPISTLEPHPAHR